jgi:hypothetical protein
MLGRLSLFTHLPRAGVLGNSALVTVLLANQLPGIVALEREGKGGWFAVLSEISKRTEETLLKHLQAFGSADVDAIMTDYDDDSVLIMPDGPLRGTAEIRSGFESLLADLPAGSTLEISTQIVEGEIAYIVWSGESETLSIPFATDTFVIRDGKIVAQTFTPQMEKKASA